VSRSSHGADHWRATLPRHLFIAAVAALVPALAGCEAGVNAPTQQWHQPTDGAAAVLHGIAIRNVFVLGAPLNSALAAGKSAGLFLAIVNTGSPDRLLSISAPGTAKSVQLPGGGPVSLAQSRPVLLTGPQPKVVLTGLVHSLQGGSFIHVIMDFQNAGSVTLSVPVLPQAQYYSTFSPAPTPTPTPTSTRKPKHAGTATATPSPIATPSPSTSS
jgi:copper(I)-binding protein